MRQLIGINTISLGLSLYGKTAKVFATNKTTNNKRIFILSLLKAGKFPPLQVSFPCSDFFILCGVLMYILGISAYYHDSAAALIKDGEIIAAAQEERFTRKKHDSAFPANAITFCLNFENIDASKLSGVVFYDKPLIKFERLLETYLSYAPKGIRSFLTSMPIWLKDKLLLKKTIKQELSSLEHFKNIELPKLFFSEHHQAHAASSFYPSPYKKAAVLCVDGVGEWATTTAWQGEENKLKLLWQIDFPHSLGLLYSAFTYYTGFKVNSGEYKLMGLAPYGDPKYVDLIYKNLIDVKEDGSYRLNMKYFNYTVGLKMTSRHFLKLFGGPPRNPESELTQKEMDLARSIQVVTEDILLKLAKTIHKETGKDHLCLAGGVALNCVANGRLLRKSPFKNIWIQPAAGDAGGAVGAALSLYHQHFNKERKYNSNQSQDSMKGAYLGPCFSNQKIKKYLDIIEAKYFETEDSELLEKITDAIKKGKVIGWFQGRMEYGPRALCNRSIIGDARNTSMQSVMNLKIKYRESFRPFAPVVLAEDVSDFFEIDRQSPYMLLVADVKKSLRKPIREDQKNFFGIDKLNIVRSEIPAVTHVDYSARIQTIHKETNPRFHSLVTKFKEKTGCSVLVNTSFNVRGEPIVCTPEDAYRCFMRTEMDFLVLENCILDKKEQPKRKKNESWKDEFELD